MFGNNKLSVQQMLGVKRFSRHGILTDHGELVFFATAPTNIAVLSYENVSQKIYHLKMVLQSIPDIGVFCTDSCECFDANRAHLMELADGEHIPAVQQLLQRDISFFDEIQAELATARQFVFCRRIYDQHGELKRQTINNTLAVLSQQGFEVQLMPRPHIKRMLAVYFGTGRSGDLFPDNEADVCGDADDMTQEDDEHD